MLLLVPLLAGCSSVTVYDIAFIGQGPNPPHLRYMDTDGTVSDPLYLPNGQAVSTSGHNALNWSRDGQRLVFASLASGNKEIYSIKADGSGVEQITDHPDSDESPEYSPEGQRIVFISNRANTNQRDIYLKNLISGNNRRLTATSNYYLSPTWHPGGDTIFYGVALFNKVTLYSLDITTDTDTQLADLPATSQGFRASPDGTKIAFYTAGGATNIHVIDADGTNQLNLTNNNSVGERFQFPAWYQSDQIIYSKIGTNEGIYRMNSNGSAKSLIGSYTNAPWSPVYRFSSIDDCTMFESLNAGDGYVVGSSVPSMVAFTVGDFVSSSGGTATDGTVRVDDRGYAGGDGNDVNTRNVTISPLHAFPTASISFKFAELGGTNNITLNGAFNQVANLVDLDETSISGVAVHVNAIQSGSNWYGVIALTGNIADFAIGGQELWIDDYCFTAP